MDNITEFKITQSENTISEGHYDLLFQLSEQQQYASEAIVQAIKTLHPLLLYAVTGAGKTEMMYEGIRVARQLGFNVAIVSPRVDVVVEISLRIKEAFISEDIDVLHKVANNNIMVTSSLQPFINCLDLNLTLMLYLSTKLMLFLYQWILGLWRQFGYHQNKNIATYL